ncbi:MAG: MarR family winged helix-turn-helix transcriptional regulator [Rhodospirillaceae bacterium]|nr:MarR family winged helix-turn-helix transcriptional regulator [Rhodospirillaceae bacterium]
MARPPADGDAGIVISPAAVAEVCFCHNLRRTTRTISRIYDQAFQPLGLKASQFNVLIAVASTAPTTQPAVARALAMDRTTLLRNLGPLKTAGLLVIIPGGSRLPDEIALTMTGQNLLAAAIKAWQGAQKQVAQQLGGSHAAQLLQGLARLAEGPAEA